MKTIVNITRGTRAGSVQTETLGNSGRAQLIHKLHVKGEPRKVVLERVRKAGYKISPSLLKRIWKRTGSVLNSNN